jgi:hypothetical protein
MRRDKDLAEGHQIGDVLGSSPLERTRSNWSRLPSSTSNRSAPTPWPWSGGQPGKIDHQIANRVQFLSRGAIYIYRYLRFATTPQRIRRRLEHRLRGFLGWEIGRGAA